MKNIFIQLIAKDFKLEWKQRYAFFGLLLYCAATIFISYLAFRQTIDAITWNALFWIILLFASVNALAKSFLSENKGQQLYFYTLSSAPVYFLSKLFYGIILMLVLSLISLLIYSSLNGFPAQDLFGYVISVIVGSIGLAVTLTMISAIASRSGSQTSLMAILGFPVLIPMLIIIIKLSAKALDGISIFSSSRELILLSSLLVLTSTLSYILFPYIWRE
ncbi:MAG: heme exporter protein CcmB [Bacteroidia bacterium]|nr:heme exporter protein CcmB [Bacteroidia bacterium]